MQINPCILIINIFCLLHAGALHGTVILPAMCVCVLEICICFKLNTAAASENQGGQMDSQQESIVNTAINLYA